MVSTFTFPETDFVGCKFPTIEGRNSNVRISPDSKTYFYRLIPGQPKPKIGDFVVTACVNGFQVCVVTELNAQVPVSRQKGLACGVGILDTEPYTVYLEKQARKAELMSQMLMKKKELEDLVTFDLLAEKSPEFKALLDQYKQL